MVKVEEQAYIVPTILHDGHNHIDKQSNVAQSNLANIASVIIDVPTALIITAILFEASGMIVGECPAPD